MAYYSPPAKKRQVEDSSEDSSPTKRPKFESYTGEHNASTDRLSFGNPTDN